MVVVYRWFIIFTFELIILYNNNNNNNNNSDTAERHCRATGHVNAALCSYTRDNRRWEDAICGDWGEVDL